MRFVCTSNNCDNVLSKSALSFDHFVLRCSSLIHDVVNTRTLSCYVPHTAGCAAAGCAAAGRAAAGCAASGCAAAGRAAGCAGPDVCIECIITWFFLEIS